MLFPSWTQVEERKESGWYCKSTFFGWKKQPFVNHFFFFQLSEAKELFKATHKITFNLDHCWAILKDAPKWQATQQEIDLKSSKTKKSRESKSTTEPPPESSNPPKTDEPEPSSPQAEHQEHDSKDNTNCSGLGNLRPEGQKTAKQKRDEDALLDKVVKAQEELV